MSVGVQRGSEVPFGRIPRMLNQVDLGPVLVHPSCVFSRGYVLQQGSWFDLPIDPLLSFPFPPLQPAIHRGALSASSCFSHSGSTSSACESTLPSSPVAP